MAEEKKYQSQVFWDTTNGSDRFPCYSARSAVRDCRVALRHGAAYANVLVFYPDGKHQSYPQPEPRRSPQLNREVYFRHDHEIRGEVTTYEWA